MSDFFSLEPLSKSKSIPGGRYKSPRSSPTKASFGGPCEELFVFDVISALKEPREHSTEYHPPSFSILALTPTRFSVLKVFEYKQAVIFHDTLVEVLRDCP